MAAETGSSTQELYKIFRCKLQPHIHPFTMPVHNKQAWHLTIRSLPSRKHTRSSLQRSVSTVYGRNN